MPVIRDWRDKFYTYFVRFVRPYGAAQRAHTAARLAEIKPTEGVARDDVYAKPAAPPGRLPDMPWNAPRMHEQSGWRSAMMRFVVSVALRFSNGITGEKRVMADRAYLRHSWNRVDATAIICYWVCLLYTSDAADE